MLAYFLHQVSLLGEQVRHAIELSLEKTVRECRWKRAHLFILQLHSDEANHGRADVPCWILVGPLSEADI